MNYDSFVRTVQERSDLSDEATVNAATEAVLATLSERLTSGEADDLADGLPENFAGALRQDDGHEAVPFGAEIFVERTRDRERERNVLDGDEADTHVEAVLHAFSGETNREAWYDTLSQLPSDYRTLYD